MKDDEVIGIVRKNNLDGALTKSLIDTVAAQSKTIDRLTILVDACLKSLSEVMQAQLIGDDEK